MSAAIVLRLIIEIRIVAGFPIFAWTAIFVIIVFAIAAGAWLVMRSRRRRQLAAPPPVKRVEPQSVSGNLQGLIRSSDYPASAIDRRKTAGRDEVLGVRPGDLQVLDVHGCALSVRGEGEEVGGGEHCARTIAASAEDRADAHLSNAARRC